MTRLTSCGVPSDERIVRSASAPADPLATPTAVRAMRALRAMDQSCAALLRTPGSAIWSAIVVSISAALRCLHADLPVPQ